MNSKPSLITLFVMGMVAVGCFLYVVVSQPTAEKIMERVLQRNYAYDLKARRFAFESSGIPFEDHADCIIWAFGIDAESDFRTTWPARWNERHSDIFIMLGSDPVTESLKRVGEAYRKRQN